MGPGERLPTSLVDRSEKGNGHHGEKVGFKVCAQLTDRDPHPRKGKAVAFSMFRSWWWCVDAGIVVVG